MLLGALLHLGVPPSSLEEGLHALRWASMEEGEGSEMKEEEGGGGWHVEVSAGEKSGIIAPQVQVVEEGQQPMRRYRDILHLLNLAEEGKGPGGDGKGNGGRKKLNKNAASLARRAFHILAAAESRAHGIPMLDVHFHEVGAIDSIVDIVSVSLAIDYLSPSSIISSPLPMGRGIIRGAAHGPLPCPAPATLDILCAHRMRTFGAGISAELVTPTGACLLAALTGGGGEEWPAMATEAVGYGCGTKVFRDRANMVRVVLGQLTEEEEEGKGGGSGGHDETSHLHSHGHGHSHTHTHSHS